MTQEIQKQLDRYWLWLKDKTQLRALESGWAEITTPYLDHHNDYLQIYARQDNGSFVLSDDGYTIGDLISSGCELSSPKRKDLLRMTLNGFGIELEENALVVRASKDNFPLQKHNLIQAMLAVNDLFYLAVPMIASLFLEDVETWLDLHEVRYTPRVKFTGKSGLDHYFDFVIPKSRVQPERILKTINHPDRNSTLIVIQAWEDTKEVRAEDAQLFAFLNDRDKAGGVSESVLQALKNYGVVPVPWSSRENVRGHLAA